MSAVEQIKAEIERRIKKIKPQNGQGIVLCDQITKQLQSLLSFVASLQQERPKVDLEKEIGKFLDETGAPYFWCGDDEQKEWCSVIARHFYELGLKARKED